MAKRRAVVPMVSWRMATAMCITPFTFRQQSTLKLIRCLKQFQPPRPKPIDRTTASGREYNEHLVAETGSILWSGVV